MEYNGKYETPERLGMAIEKSKSVLSLAFEELNRLRKNTETLGYQVGRVFSEEDEFNIEKMKNIKPYIVEVLTVRDNLEERIKKATFNSILKELEILDESVKRLEDYYKNVYMQTVEQRRLLKSKGE